MEARARPFQNGLGHFGGQQRHRPKEKRVSLPSRAIGFTHQSGDVRLPLPLAGEVGLGAARPGEGGSAATPGSAFQDEVDHALALGRAVLSGRPLSPHPDILRMSTSPASGERQSVLDTSALGSHDRCVNAAALAGRGKGFSPSRPAWTLAIRLRPRDLFSAHSRADARSPLPLPPSRKGRGLKGNGSGYFEKVSRRLRRPSPQELQHEIRCREGVVGIDSDDRIHGLVAGGLEIDALAAVVERHHPQLPGAGGEVAGAEGEGGVAVGLVAVGIDAGQVDLSPAAKSEIVSLPAGATVLSPIAV